MKRSVVINGHDTSVSVEEPFWVAMKSIARQRRMSLSCLISALDEDRVGGNLSSAIRLFVLKQAQAVDQKAA